MGLGGRRFVRSSPGFLWRDVYTPTPSRGSASRLRRRAVAFFAVPYTIIHLPVSIPGLSPTLACFGHKQRYTTAEISLRAGSENPAALAVTITASCDQAVLALQLVGISLVSLRSASPGPAGR